jgi:hypothetical protein
MVVITYDDNTSASSVEIPPTSNGIAPFIPAKPVIKSHPDKHVKDMSTMMESMAITILKESMMETSLESVYS